MDLPALAALAAVCAAPMAAAMAWAWRWQDRTGRTGAIDVVWSFAVGATAALAALAPLGAGGATWRQLAVAALAAAWSLRLGLHIQSRGGFGKDDPRYRHLADEWGADARRRMFRFLQAQAAVGAALAFAVGLAAHHPAGALRVQDVAGAVLLAAAVLGEAAADRQLAAFAREPANKGKVCDVGLWAWSRHPNYFFEWLGWTAYPVIAVDMSGEHPFGWLALAAPAVMYWVLRYASGVPPLEQHMLRTRPEAFRAYRARTSVFFPWPPLR